ncbi:MAG: 50S ribosomal protein L4 [Candidatus Omnitrophota bacterium]|jgi:large subunit ribosomal protein L4|nr:MAG: 50S ribosomal protein L4 [Candidatus Omnitrophota bacterium]
MVTLDVFDQQKNVIEQIELDEAVFSAPVNEVFLHQVLVGYRANQRQGTAKTKCRSEIAGSNRKPFRQKGTGRARQGTIHAPHHRGGATQFGPTPRSYRKKISKKMKQEAMRQCFSMKIGAGQFFILNDLNFQEMKTKQAARILDSFHVRGKSLFVDVDPNMKTVVSVRNMKIASIESANSCSPLDLFEVDNLFLTKAAVQLYQQRLAKTGGMNHAA